MTARGLAALFVWRLLATLAYGDGAVAQFLDCSDDVYLNGNQDKEGEEPGQLEVAQGKAILGSGRSTGGYGTANGENDQAGHLDGSHEDTKGTQAFYAEASPLPGLQGLGGRRAKAAFGVAFRTGIDGVGDGGATGVALARRGLSARDDDAACWAPGRVLIAAGATLPGPLFSCHERVPCSLRAVGSVVGALSVLLSHQ